MKPTLPSIALAALALALAAAPSAVRSEIEAAHKYNKPDPRATPLAFEKTDFINVVRDPAPKTKFFLGEPVSVPIRLINHTQFQITVLTNMNPRGNLSVTIQAEYERDRKYNGPFLAGSYVPDEFVLYPLEERVLTAMLWGDLDSPSGLAFPKPGRYRIRIGVGIGAQLSPAAGEIQVEPFDIVVEPPPPAYAPLVEELIKIKAFPDLQLKRPPEGKEVRLRELEARFPVTALSPYLCHALGLHHYRLASRDEDFNNPDFAIAAEYLQKAALADSEYKSDAWQDLLRLYDRRGMAPLAKQAAEELIKSSRPDWAPIYGSLPYVKKYLINSTEMHWGKYWDLLE